MRSLFKFSALVPIYGSIGSTDFDSGPFVASAYECPLLL